MINYVYNKAEHSNSETLHVRTKEIKDDITLQMISDRENLITIASMAENIYAQRETISAVINKDSISDIVNAVKESNDFSIIFDCFIHKLFKWKWHLQFYFFVFLIKNLC